jgi:phosphoribosylamine--glycine ligase
MITLAGPQVLEYNCRLGDPETEAILMRADFDFAETCLLAARGKLASAHAKWRPGASACVVLASKGYPSNPVTGVRIDGLDEAARVPGAVILHAGTRRDQGVFYSTGGRVLVVCARGATLPDACGAAYSAITKIDVRGAHYRTDIGATRTAKV